MEKNKKSLLDIIFGSKKDEDGTLTGKKCIPCGAINARDAKFCFACGSAFPVIYDSYDGFISYRRENASDLASLLKVQLENNFHKRIFIDIKELQEGRFDEALLNRIEETPNFILILSKSSLDKCKEKSDWLKREIIHAIDTRRNIIPVLMKDFTFPTDDLWELFPEKMRLLSSLNGINYDHIHQDSDIRRIASYMKTEKEVPPLKVAPVPDKPEPPPPRGGGATKPVPGQSGSGNPGKPSTEPVGTGAFGTGQTSGMHTTTGQINTESLVFMRRGDNLNVGTRSSKNRSVYYGPGTVLQYAEKGQGETYPWYRFDGVDGKDYWLERYNPVYKIDNRTFFRINETGQVGYLAEILGERDEPWGSVEVFRFDDDIAGPTEVRFDQIISMTSINGTISIKKESGIVSGTLQKPGNYKSGFNPKGPCLVSSDAVIPLIRTNRESSITVSRISESEKPPLVPVSVYGSKTQLQFLLKGNSAVGHFDDTIPDIYIQFNEHSLGWMRIYIPSILRLVVDPDFKEAPVTVETSAGRVYKGICHDPFNFSGSVISFANAKKPLSLEPMGRESVRTVTDGELIKPERQATSNNSEVKPVSSIVSGGAIDKDHEWIMRTTIGPGQRSDFGMVYDDKKEIIILQGGFGRRSEGNNHSTSGISQRSPEQDDTWAWDGSSWKLLNIGSLSLVGHAMAYDRKTGQNMILGGWTGSQRIKHTYVLLDDKWMQTDAGNIFQAGGFQNHALAYDEKRKTVILFGGLTITIPGGQMALSDTWEWTSSGWSELHVDGPDPRWGHKMVYDQRMGVIVLFGGTNGTTYFDDTWLWEGHTGSWTKVSSRAYPSARCNHGMVYDAFSRKVLIFGGLSAGKLPLNDLWEWNGAEWVLLMNLAPPKPRYNHGFAYDAKRKKSILYGGTDGNDFFRDTWELVV